MRDKEFQNRVNTKLYEKYGWTLSKAKIQQVVNCLFDTIKEVLKEQEIIIKGFGRFSITKTKPYRLETPLTQIKCPGGVANVPAMTYPRFHVSKAWRHDMRHYFDNLENEKSFKKDKLVPKNKMDNTDEN